MTVPVFATADEPVALAQQEIEPLRADYESKQTYHEQKHTFAAMIDLGDYPVPTVIVINSNNLLKYEEDENGNDILRKATMFAYWDEVTGELRDGASMDVNYISLNNQNVSISDDDSVLVDPRWVWDSRSAYPDRKFVAQESYTVEGHAILSAPALLPRIYGVTNAIEMHQ